MKAKCEICGSKTELIEFPTQSGEHTFCMHCAGQAAVEALRWMQMGEVRMVEKTVEQYGRTN